MTDSKFLTWVADRLVHVYGENPDVDFVQKLRRMASRAQESEIRKEEQNANRTAAK